MGYRTGVLKTEDAWGVVTIHPATDKGPDRTLLGSRLPHARLSDFRTVTWEPSHALRGRNVALDAEALGTSMPQSVVGRLKASNPFHAQRQWTRVEVVAKLTDTPMLVLLRQDPSEPRGIVMDSQVFGGVWVTRGFCSVDAGHR